MSSELTMTAVPFQLPRRVVLTAFAAVLALAAAPSFAATQRGVVWERTGSAIVDPALDKARGAVEVIVSAVPGAMSGLTGAVTQSGGTVQEPLPIADAVSASVPASQLDDLAQNPTVKAITLDRVGQFEAYSFDETSSASNFVASTGAGKAWESGYTGRGVGVAVIDTGISPMNDVKGRTVYGPDLSGEGSIVDSYGHGTVMAGVIGGNGADSAGRTGGAYTGVAPGATLVSVKTAGRNGAVDVSTILQAMHWVAAYKDQYNIRVVNLAWGTSSTQSPTVDPLNYAVERLWQLGIVVVVSAGNSGPNSGTITKPADDPLVLSVGAYDDKQTPDAGDDSVASWSSRGPTAQGLAKPDLVTPGRYIIAQRSFGSTIEQDNPKALWSPSYIRGSGTSQASAVTSGLAALLLQAHPDWTPDQVKTALKSTASPISGLGSNSQGAGRVNLTAAMSANPGAAVQQTPVANGLGSLDASRGGVYIQTTCNGAVRVIQGEIDTRCAPWNGAAWTGAAWTGAAWTGAAWTGAAWTGSDWMGGAWTGAAWTGAAWTGGAWTGAAWTGAAWTGDSWSGAAWTGAAWTGAAWTGAAWTGAAWTGAAWTSAEYDEFMTAFWGNRPPWWVNLPGEKSEKFSIADIN
jgi:serine protease AprX